MMQVSTSELIRVFGRIGVLSFGGPAAQISLMQTELVDRHKWLTEDQFLKALSFCMLLPGPEAMQLATYAGWRLRGVPGGLLAGLLFVLPGALVITALGFGYAYFGQVPLVQTAFMGIKAAVVVIVFQALFKLARRALTSGLSRGLALAAFIAIFFLSVPFPIIIACAALIGWVLSEPAAEPTSQTPVTERPATLSTVAIWGTLWAAPIGLLWLIEADLLLDMALFFSKLAIVTFGGAYAVLAYMTQEIVQSYGWLTTDQMIDSLGLAETTPGPLILVTQFTAFLTGFQTGGPGLALAAAVITLWVTFIPCFLWIFVAAPYVEALLARPRLKGAFDAISASVAGVILNLAVWFTLHVLFAQVPQTRFGPLPEIDSLLWFNAVLIALAALIFLKLRWPMVPTLLAMATLAGISQPIFGL
ncbi:chromate efflux transporter [Roseovarius phycicola]|uniref:Chromate efflux transporter n=1 Tax=Roseovarius phycicola TaxID=3080976 RepID=A0ABZ2HJT4_9RHOB